MHPPHFDPSQPFSFEPEDYSLAETDFAAQLIEFIARTAQERRRFENAAVRDDQGPAAFRKLARDAMDSPEQCFSLEAQVFEGLGNEPAGGERGDAFFLGQLCDRL